jgi:hypothetical protein
MRAFPSIIGFGPISTVDLPHFRENLAYFGLGSEKSFPRLKRRYFLITAERFGHSKENDPFAGQ